MNCFAKYLQLVAVLLALAWPAFSHAGESPTSAASGVVNITNANAEELERLPGIGEKKAQAILDHRKSHPLHKLEDLTKVKGIGRKTVARLRPYLTLNGPTTLLERAHLHK